MARYIHWQLCDKCGWERANGWYEQKPEGVVESENFKIQWDFTAQCDWKIEARRPDIVFIDNKEREVVIIDVAIPGDDRVKGKEEYPSPRKQYPGDPFRGSDRELVSNSTRHELKSMGSSSTYWYMQKDVKV